MACFLLLQTGGFAPSFALLSAWGGAFLPLLNGEAHGFSRRSHCVWSRLLSDGGNHRELGCKDGLHIDAHGHHDVDGHVRRFVGGQLQSDGAAFLETDIHRLVAAVGGGSHPNHVVGHHFGNGGVLRTGNDCVVDGEQPHAHEVVQIAVPRPRHAQHGRQSGVQTGVGSVRAGRQHMAQSQQIAKGHHIGNTRAVQHGNTLGRSDPVGVGEGELHIGGGVHGVGAGRDQSVHPQRRDLAVHTSGDGVEGTAQISVVARQLIPLPRRLGGTQGGVHGQGFGIQVVGGLGTGGTPAVVLEQEDVVALHVDLVGLAQWRIHGLGQPVHSVTESGGENGGHDIGHDTGQRAQEDGIGEVAALVLAELFHRLGRFLAFQLVAHLCAEQEQVFLNLLVQRLIGHVLAHHGIKLFLTLLSVAQGVHALAGVFRSQQTAAAHDVGAFDTAAALRGVHIENTAGKVVQTDAIHCHCLSTPFRSAGIHDGEVGFHIDVAEAAISALGKVASTQYREIGGPVGGGLGGCGKQQTSLHRQELVGTQRGRGVADTETVMTALDELDLGEGHTPSGGSGKAQRVRANLEDLVGHGVLHLVHVEGVASVNFRIHQVGSIRSNHLPCVVVIHAGVALVGQQCAFLAQETGGADFLGVGAVEENAGDVGLAIELMVGNLGFESGIGDVCHVLSLSLFQPVVSGHNVALAFAAQIFVGVPYGAGAVLGNGLGAVLADHVHAHGLYSRTGTFVAVPFAVRIHAVGVHIVVDVLFHVLAHLFVDLRFALSFLHLVDLVQCGVDRVLCHLAATCLFLVLHFLDGTVQLFHFGFGCFRLFRRCGKLFLKRAHIVVQRGGNFQSVIYLYGHSGVSALEAGIYHQIGFCFRKGIDLNIAVLLGAKRHVQSVFGSADHFVIGKHRFQLTHPFAVAHVGFHSFICLFCGLRFLFGFAHIGSCPQLKLPKVHLRQRPDFRSCHCRGYVVAKDGHAQNGVLFFYFFAVLHAVLGYKRLDGYGHAPLRRYLFHRFPCVPSPDRALADDPFIAFSVLHAHIVLVHRERADDPFTVCISEAGIFLPVGSPLHAEVVPIARFRSGARVGNQDGFPGEQRPVPFQVFISPSVGCHFVVQQFQFHRIEIIVRLLQKPYLAGKRSQLPLFRRLLIKSAHSSSASLSVSFFTQLSKLVLPGLESHIFHASSTFVRSAVFSICRFSALRLMELFSVPAVAPINRFSAASTSKITSATTSNALFISSMVSSNSGVPG
nr:MAG TPA: hypothetical protein [Caudoviricetes sp.]